MWLESDQDVKTMHNVNSFQLLYAFPNFCYLTSIGSKFYHYGALRWQPRQQSVSSFSTFVVFSLLLNVRFSVSLVVLCGE